MFIIPSMTMGSLLKLIFKCFVCVCAFLFKMTVKQVVSVANILLSRFGMTLFVRVLVTTKSKR